MFSMCATSAPSKQYGLILANKDICHLHEGAPNLGVLKLLSTLVPALGQQEEVLGFPRRLGHQR